MDTLESLHRQMESAHSLQGVVRTMKALSMASIRQCEQAASAIDNYEHTVRRGLQGALRHRLRDQSDTREAEGAPAAVLVFGSTWGMCGRFNEQLAQDAAEHLQRLSDEDASAVTLLAFGDYVGGALAAAGHPPDQQTAGPESVEGITRRVQDTLIRVEAWRATDGVERIHLLHNHLLSGTQYALRKTTLLPLDQGWLDALEAEPWPTNQVPMVRGAWNDVFAALVRQYLFVSVYRAFAASLASEHSSRLAAMQRAESNVEERLDRLHMQYHQQRQTAITEEVLDVTAGYTAAKRLR